MLHFVRISSEVEKRKIPGTPRTHVLQRVTDATTCIQLEEIILRTVMGCQSAPKAESGRSSVHRHLTRNGSCRNLFTDKGSQELAGYLDHKKLSHQAFTNVLLSPYVLIKSRWYPSQYGFTVGLRAEKIFSQQA